MRNQLDGHESSFLLEYYISQYDNMILILTTSCLLLFASQISWLLSADAKSILNKASSTPWDGRRPILVEVRIRVQSATKVTTIGEDVYHIFFVVHAVPLRNAVPD